MRIAFPGVLAIALSGCATANYPPLYTPPALTADSSAAAILEQARVTQESYAADYLKLSKRNDLLNVPVLGVATAGAALLFAKASPDLLFGLGLGAAAYTQGRTRFEPTTLAGLYMQGHEAMGCVRRNGAVFGVPTARQSRDQLASAVDNLAEARLEAEIVSMETLPAKTPAGEASIFQAAQLRLRDQITLAKAAETDATLELKAFAGAPQVLGAAVETVQRTVATRGRAGRDGDIKDLTQTLLSEGKGWVTSAAPATTGDGGPAVPAAAEIERNQPASASPVAALRALFDATRDVQRLSPGFVASLKKIETCPMISG